MSEFTFSCPGCQQSIEVSTESCGQSVHCPVCQQLLIVPADPNGPAAPRSRLSSAPSTVTHSQGGAAAAAATMYQSARPKTKKKSKVNLIVGLCLGAIGVAAAIYFYPTLIKYVTHEKTPSPSAVAEAAPTNEPPPPPPELTTQEVFEKVDETYKSLTDYAAKAETQATIEVPNGAQGRTTVRMRTVSSLQLGRTNYYRLEWDQETAGKFVKGAAWCSGKGNFVGYANVPPGRVRTRQKALEPASSLWILSPNIAELFFSDTNSLATQAQYFTKTNSPGPNGQDCYALAGTENFQNTVVWVNKSSFLISQIEVILGATPDGEQLHKLPKSQQGIVLALSKWKGTITETYSTIQTNNSLVASAFETSYKPVASASNAGQQRRGTSPTSPTQLANPQRNRSHPQ